MNITINIPDFMVMGGITLGAGLAFFIFIVIWFRANGATNTARHNYMARLLSDERDKVRHLRDKHNDDEPIEITHSYTSERWNYKLMTFLLDFYYGGIDPDKGEGRRYN